MAKGGKMGIGGKGRNKSNMKNLKKLALQHQEDLSQSDMDDEIDAFHKQRNLVPLDVENDLTDPDEDDEQPVFAIEDASEDDDDDDDDDDAVDDQDDIGFIAKIKRQSKSLWAKGGGVEDEMYDDAEDDEAKRTVWGKSKSMYYEVDRELQSSDDDQLSEDEDEVLKMQNETLQERTNDDYGLKDDSEDEDDEDRTFGEILANGNAESKASKVKENQEEIDTAYEVVVKDLNALSREEQMDIIYSSAPELVGLLSELNDALEQLESKVDPILSMVSEKTKIGLQYMELKKQLLLSYSQAIVFYLLLKSEGMSVRDHPVIARLVEIKNLLDKVKQLDENLPIEVNDILNKKHDQPMANNLSLLAAVDSIPVTNIHKPSAVSSDTRKEAPDSTELAKVDHSSNHDKKRKHKRLKDQLDFQSMEMLKVRADFEEKLKQKGVFSFTTPNHPRDEKYQRPVNGKLESLADFNDDALDIEGNHQGMSNGHANGINSNRLSQLVAPQFKKPKVISGDDDLPKRDDIGERRRKHEQRVIARAGIQSDDDNQDDDLNEGHESESDLELYEETKSQRAAKLAAKAEKYSRLPAIPSLPEILEEGKRHINYEIEKNRGLTRNRNKQKKNPRVNAKKKYKNKLVARKGQVREIRKPTGPYGGETTGINAGISRSIRFKN